MQGHGTVYWTELMTDNIEKSKAFYTKTLGWTYQSMPMPEGGTYWTFAPAGADQPAGGMFEFPASQGPTNMWFTYFHVDDLDAALARLVAAGGKVYRPPFDVPNVGRIAIVADATGAGSGWMTPAAR